MKILRDWFTGVDGVTWDLGRWLWALAISAPIAVAFVQVVGSSLALGKASPLGLWTAQDWAIWAGGTSALMVAGAGALYMKRSTEPSTTSTTATVVTPDAATGAKVEETHG